MARVQDFQSVTPSSANDNLLIVQATGQGLAKIDAVGQKIATDTDISSLNTTSKKIAGAINELNINKAETSATYTKTQVDSLLSSKLNTSTFESIYKTTSWGSFAGLVQNNQTWLFVAQRKTVTDTYICVMNRYNDTFHRKDIIKDSSMSVATNSQGTVTFAYGGSSTGVHVMALKIAEG